MACFFPDCPWMEIKEVVCRSAQSPRKPEPFENLKPEVSCNGEGMAGSPKQPRPSARSPALALGSVRTVALSSRRVSEGIPHSQGPLQMATCGRFEQRALLGFALSGPCGWGDFEFFSRLW